MPSFFERTRAATRAAYHAFRDPGMMESEYKPLDLPTSRRDYCTLLDLYYEGRVYRELLAILGELNRGKDFSKIRFLENPAAQAVRFYVIHLYPGPLEEAMPLVAEGGRSSGLRDAAETVLRNSNMGRKKRLFSDYQARHGEVFIYNTSTQNGAPYMRLRKSAEITDFEEDARGHIVWLRRDAYTGEKGSPWFTEEWSKEDQVLRTWKGSSGPASELKNLGPAEETALSEFGVDFVPYVRAVFEEGEHRGVGVFERHLEPMDELNRQGTYLRDRYFRYGKATHLTRANEPNAGAVNVKVGENVDQRPSPRDKGKGLTEEKHDGETWINLPGMADHKFLVPDIDWEAGLNMIADTREKSLENSMAELRYFRGHDKGDPSAAAMRQHIGPAIQSAREAKGNADTALIQSIQQCITIGVHTGAFSGASVGSYENDDFALSFAARDLFPESPSERAEREKADAEAIQGYIDISPELGAKALVERGYSEADAKRIANEAANRSSRNDLASVFGRGGLG